MSTEKRQARSCHEVARILGIYKTHNLEDIEEGIGKFHEEHGKAPTQESGDACGYVGYSTSWKKMDKWMRANNHGSLIQLCNSMGLQGCHADHGFKKIKEGARAYYKEHGSPPGQRSGNASRYVGYSTSWGNINSWLKANNHGSITQVCKAMGIVGRCAPHDLRKIQRGLRGYYRRHRKIPKVTSEDASEYVGYLTSWKNLDQWLRHRDQGSLIQLCKSMGFEGSYADHDLKKIRVGIRKSHKERGGYPSVKSGDAAEYVGYSTTWVAINSWLAGHGHGSLSQLCKVMGLSRPVLARVP